jgi:hypothetical protein
MRITTREERLDRCQGALARVDAALSAWIETGEQHACVSDAEINAMRQRRDAIEALLATDRFSEVETQASQEEAFLRTDAQARLVKAAEAHAAARSTERRMRESAAAVRRMLHDSGLALPEDLMSGLERGDVAAIERGFTLLAHAQTQARASAATDLAAHLTHDQAPLTLTAWLASQPGGVSDPAIEQIDVRLAELADLVDAHVVHEWRQRLDKAAQSPDARRDLLLDGLEVETGRALTSARRRRAALSELDATGAELETLIKGESKSLRAGVKALTEDDIRARIARARQTIAFARGFVAATARRTAVLEGLRALGYEVTEGMSSSWVEHGRIVARSSSRPEYGVELSGQTESGRLQLRAVALTEDGVGPDPRRDRDAETIWCAEASGLAARLSTLGDDLVIERALPIGATPLKRVEHAGASSHAATTAAPALRRKALT